MQLAVILRASGKSAREYSVGKISKLLTIPHVLAQNPPPSVLYDSRLKGNDMHSPTTQVFANIKNHRTTRWLSSSLALALFLTSFLSCVVLPAKKAEAGYGKWEATGALPKARSLAPLSQTRKDALDGVYIIPRTPEPGANISIGSRTGKAGAKASAGRYSRSTVTRQSRIKATDAGASRSTASSTLSSVDGKLSAPTALRVWYDGAGACLNLSWIESTDDVGVASYVIERSPDGESGWEVVETVPGTETTCASAVAPGDQARNWYYRVKAVDEAGQASGYSEVAVEYMPDVTPPMPPASLKVKVVRSTWAEVSWSGATDNVGVETYPVEVSIDGVNYKNAGSVPGDYCSIRLLPAQKYFLRVRAKDAEGNVSAAPSPTVTIVTPPAIPNDADADTKSDAISFYDYGNGNAGLFVFRNVFTKNAAVPTFSQKRWDVPDDLAGFCLCRAKSVSGDFNGDGNADVMTLYKESSASDSALVCWFSKGSGYREGALAFRSDTWDWSKTKLVAGDFNGDGVDELAALYSYGGTTVRMFVFDENDSGLEPREVFYSNQWNWSKTRLLSVRNGVKSKIMAVYDYGKARTGIFVFEPGKNGTLSAQKFFDSKEGGWDASRSRWVATDVNGDGKTDLAAFYDYGKATTGVFLFKATGKAGSKAFGAPQQLYTLKEWNSTKANFLPGDFNADGKGDVAAVYDYGNNTIGFWSFAAKDGKLTQPKKANQVSGWNNRAASWVKPY